MASIWSLKLQGGAFAAKGARRVHQAPIRRRSGETPPLGRVRQNIRTADSEAGAFSSVCGGLSDRRALILEIYELAPRSCVMHNRLRARRGGRARFKAHAWNACRLERVSGVRIPPSPPTSLRFEAFSGEVHKLRACGGDAHRASHRRALTYSSRGAVPSIFSLCASNSVPMPAVRDPSQRPGGKPQISRAIRRAV